MRNLTTILMLIASVGLYAQEAVSTAGGDGTGIGGSTSYTVGQTNYTTNANTSGTVAQGVQSPFEVYTTVGLEETKINLDVVAFPNPTNNLLTLNIGDFNTQKLSFELYDLQGKQLYSQPIVSRNTSISTQDLPGNIYLLSVLKNQIVIKTFRIVKN